MTALLASIGRELGREHPELSGWLLARDRALPEAMTNAIPWHHADFVLDMVECPLADRTVEMIALGVLGDQAIERHHAVGVSDASARVLDAALTALRYDRRQHAELPAEASSLLCGMDSRPQPTLRLPSPSLN